MRTAPLLRVWGSRCEKIAKSTIAKSKRNTLVVEKPLIVETLKLTALCILGGAGASWFARFAGRIMRYHTAPLKTVIIV